MIGAEETQVFRSIVSRVSVNMIDMDRYAARMRIPIAPAADAALFTVGCDQVLPDVARRFVEACRRAVNFSG